MSHVRHANIILIRVMHMGRIISQVSPSGWKRRVTRMGRVCAHVRRPISMPFSLVASSLPPLHSGMVKSKFWQLLFLSKNQTPLYTISFDTNLLGILLMRNGGVHDHCSKETKHTNTQYLTWFGKSPTSTGVVYIIRDRERIQHTEEDHIHSTPISHCCIGLLVATLLSCSLLLSFVLALSHTLSFCVALLVSIYRLQWQLILLLCQQWWLPSTTHHCSLLLWQYQDAANAAPAALFDSHKLAFFLWQWQSSSSRGWAADAVT